MSGRLVDIAVTSDAKTYYVASATGGVWKTTDNGVRFSPVFEREAVHSVGDIAVHQEHSEVVWVGTGERANRQSSSWGDGVYRSTDGGGSWTRVGLEDSHHIGRIALHPADPEVAFVAAMGHLWGPNDERGLYRTTDGGGSWERILFVDSETGVVDVALDPANPDALLAASYQRQRRPWGFHGGGPGSALYRSADGGDTWTRLTNAGLDNGLPSGDLGRIGISIHAADPRIVYASIEQGARYNASTAYEERRAGLYRSTDGGASWELRSDWNPRPMYASQPVADPNDPERVYMLNSYSYSDDGGLTFNVPRGHRTHGDDRFVWVNPRDSEHVLKADDGGLGISYDRGDHFLYVTSLPVSQFYHVSVDMAHPYNVYGGLQDNGSWKGPNAAYRSEGILNEDWSKWGGGDGFWNVVDTSDGRTLYSESQYLGLNRIDMVTGESRFIRPNQPEGYIAPRRNWTTWPDPDAPEQRLGNAMPPGNWEGPFVISPHDPSTLYAGLNELFKSTDRGESWISLGKLVTGADRRSLRIMGQLPDSTVLSLDDGIPYWPTISAVEESRHVPGVLYAGTDDGQVLVSEDDGGSWQNVTDAMPEAPEMMWVNRIHASASVAGRVYVAANNYRNDDYANYLWGSDDRGATWFDATGDLPAERVVRAVREDERNPDVLYLGTEFGVWWSWNRGANWIELEGGLPTQPVNDLVVHPRDNDLVLGTHGRGVWILDQVNALQEMNAVVLAGGAHLFTVEPAEQIRYRSRRGHTGNMIFEGENPPAGAIIDYWLSSAEAEPALAILAEDGAEVARVPASSGRGVRRAVWNLRYGGAGAEGSSGGGRFPGGRLATGPWVAPDRYTVRLEAAGVIRETVVEVREDPRIETDEAVRRSWTSTMLELWELAKAAAEFRDEVAEAGNSGPTAGGVRGPTKAEDLVREAGELASRAARLYTAGGGWIGPLSADLASQREFVARMLDALRDEWVALSAPDDDYEAIGDETPERTGGPSPDGSVEPTLSPTPTEDVTAFVNVTVLPMTGEGPLADRTVLVENEVITRVGAASELHPPAGSTVIDGAGGYLMPGLAEMHAHVPPGADPPREAVEDILFLYVANGITSIRGMLGSAYQIPLAAEIERGETLGPTFYVGAPSLNGRSVQEPEDAERLIRAHKEAGYHLQKIHPGVSRTAWDRMVLVAGEVGFTYGGHVPADVGLEHALRTGMSTVDHLDGYVQAVASDDVISQINAGRPVSLGGLVAGFDEDKLREVVALTVETGAYVVPTMYLWENLYGAPDADAALAQPEMRYVSQAQREAWRRQAAGGPRGNQEEVAAFLDLRKRVLKELSEAGAGILMGTDSPQLFNVPGFALHREIALMEEAGMSPMAILVSGTRAVGEYVSSHLGLDGDFGTVEPGRRADLVLLGSNPLDNLSALADRRGVMVRGRWVSRNEIDRGLEALAAKHGG